MYLLNPNGVRQFMNASFPFSTVPLSPSPHNSLLVRSLSNCVQEFVSYHGKNTTAAELAAKILSAVDDFKQA
jgi:hypothetical protein